MPRGIDACTPSEHTSSCALSNSFEFSRKLFLLGFGFPLNIVPSVYIWDQTQYNQCLLACLSVHLVSAAITSSAPVRAATYF